MIDKLIHIYMYSEDDYIRDLVVEILEEHYNIKLTENHKGDVYWEVQTDGYVTKLKPELYTSG